jgi:hypothetical protein
MFDKFKTNQMHDFSISSFILFYFSSDMFRRAVIFKEEYIDFLT